MARAQPFSTGTAVRVRPRCPLIVSRLENSGWNAGEIYVVANIRGGGEFGPNWEKAGEILTKQNAFDDMAAVAKSLIDTGVSSPQHLGLKGVSCGGLMSSAVAVEHPEYFAAVKSEVGIHDVINMKKFPAGDGYVAWFGDPGRADVLAVMERYSPFQNVKAGQKYPKMFYDTRTYDQNAFPAQSRRIALRMTETGHDVLFFEDPSPSSGHEGPAPTDLEGNIREKAMEFTFFWKYLGQSQ